MKNGASDINDYGQGSKLFRANQKLLLPAMASALFCQQLIKAEARNEGSDAIQPKLELEPDEDDDYMLYVLFAHVYRYNVQTVHTL